MASVKEVAPMKEDHTPSIHFHVDKESTVKIDLTGLEIGEQVSLQLTGKIDSLSKDKWGQSLGMRVSSAKLGCGKIKSEAHKNKFSTLLVRRRSRG